MPLIECVPNFSEGRDPAVIDAIAAAITAAHGRVLDASLDASHNRAVITFVADANDIGEAAFAAIRTARDRIDLTAHTGVHPRIGAADVVPFIPLDGASMDDCVRIARTLAQRVGAELEIPAYLYEHAARNPAYRNLADVRHGGTAALAASIATTRQPDAGPHRLHPTAGAVAIGARHFLGAFNVFVGDATQIEAARAIARDLRAAGGGLPGLKALGLIVDGQAQVSMNVTDLATVPLHAAFDAVATAAARHGTRATHSEIIGLVPQHIIEQGFADRILLRDARQTVSLEHRIAQTAPVTDLSRIAGAIADLDVAEASGTATALAAVLASSTVRLAAGVHVRRKHSHVADEMARIVDAARELEVQLHRAARDDAQAWDGVVQARRLPAGTAAEQAARQDAIDRALLHASDVPLRIARLAGAVLAIASETATAGDRVTAPDAWTGANLAFAALVSALGLMRSNLAMLAVPALAHDRRAEASSLLTGAERSLATAKASVSSATG